MQARHDNHPHEEAALLLAGIALGMLALALVALEAWLPSAIVLLASVWALLR